jgi:hypothetical protein
MIYANTIVDKMDEANFSRSLTTASKYDEQKVRKLVHTIA